MARIIQALIILTALGGCHRPATHHQTGRSMLQDRLDEIFSERYDDPAAPGAAVIIARGDTVLYERYFGLADMDTGEAVDSATLFNIASVSKQFTVVALLQQDIDIDTPASEFFDFPQPFWKDITLAHLASHSSGIPDKRDRSDRQRCIYADEEVSASYFPYVDSLEFRPGTDYDYLNPSFILLSRVVEQLSGEEFTEYMKRHIFLPLGMDSTVYFSPQGMPAHAAHGYVPGEDGGWKQYDYGEEAFFATRPDGGIYSTAREMLKWENGLASGRILDSGKLQQAYTPRVNVSDSKWCDYQRRPNTWYGLGWFVETDTPLGTKVYHTGDNGGFQAYVAKYPESDLRVIVLENRNDRSRWQLATAIESLLAQAMR